MTKNDFDFDTWFDSLINALADNHGIHFDDQESVRTDYERGRNCADVAAEIANEYDC